jgi:hypothetical protein
MEANGNVVMVATRPTQRPLDYPIVRAIWTSAWLLWLLANYVHAAESALRFPLFLFCVSGVGFFVLDRFGLLGRRTVTFDKERGQIAIREDFGARREWTIPFSEVEELRVGPSGFIWNPRVSVVTRGEPRYLFSLQYRSSFKRLKSAPLQLVEDPA